MTIDGAAAREIVATRADAGRSTRRKDIQGLRAVAVLLVVAYHGGLAIPGGFTGVDVFFVISGFVITSMLLRQVATGGRVSFATFYSRRVRRILPALATMIVVVAAGSFLAISPLEPRHTTAKTGVAASTFVANIFLYNNPRGYFGASPGTNPLLHTWSLSVEEQFYLVFPVLLVIAWWLSGKVAPQTMRRAVTASMIGVGVVASFALCYVCTQGSLQGPRFAFYMAPARAWEFGVGAILAFGVPLLGRVPRAVAVAAGVLGALLVAYGAFQITASTPFPGKAALYPVVGTALLIAAGQTTSTGVSGFLGIRPMTWIGDLSYSWYLWHWPLIVFVRGVWPDSPTLETIVAFGSLLPAWLAFRWIENPIRLNTRFVGRRALALALVCIVVPVVACTVLARVQFPPESSGPSRARLLALTQRHADETHHCALGAAMKFGAPRCTVHAPNSRGTVVLLGDSNAGHFSEPAIKASKAHGYDLELATHHGCRFVDVIVVRSGRPDRACPREVEHTLAYLAQHKPSLVLLAFSSPEIIQPSNVHLKDPVTKQVARTRAQKEAMWQQGLERVLTALHNADVPVALIQTIPQFPKWEAHCAAARVALRPASCGTSTPRAAVDRYRHGALDAELRAVRAVPGTAVVDFADQLCRHKVCSTNWGNFWLYEDGNHLTIPGALRFTKQFDKFVTNMAIPRPPISPATPVSALGVSPPSTIPTAG